ncbi:MAG TPA: hypothetical protein VIQ51_15860 [Chryseosolibacter sp.]
MMPEQSPEDSEAIRHLINNRPEEDYCGLTFNEMRRLSFETFEADSPLQINPSISDQALDSLPFFRLTEEFLKIIQRDGYVKLTPLGALPKKILTGLYSHRFILEEAIEKEIHKLTREVDSPALSALHNNTVLSGLIRKANGKLFLTKVGSKLLTTRGRNKIFMRALYAYTDKLPWSNLDGYPALPVGNLGWGFSILMLLQEGDTPRAASYYAAKYLKAFPEFHHTYPLREYSTPERDLIRIYCLRTFDRFLEWWGFVKADRPISWLERDLTLFTAAPALKEIFQFDS